MNGIFSIDSLVYLRLFTAIIYFFNFKNILNLELTLFIFLINFGNTSCVVIWILKNN